MRENILRIKENMKKVIIGKDEVMDRILTALLSGGHVLLEDLPGTGKTVLAKSLAKSMNGEFRRVQFTPDLLPSDVTGLHYFNQKEGEFQFREGPVFTQILLADEINRATPRTQSSLLECMEERQVTIDGETRKLDEVFFVIATQNPIESSGTFPLPEAQMDRFLLKEVITYPTPVEELEVLSRVDSGQMTIPSPTVPITLDDVLTLQEARRRVFIHETLKAYIVDIINTTRGAGPNPLPGWSKHVRVGASPRGGIALMQIAQSLALMAGRNHVMPDDIKEMRYGILRHRIIRTFDALADNVSIEGLIDAVFNAVPVP